MKDFFSLLIRCVLLLLALAMPTEAAPPLLKPEWTFDPGESVVGYPVPLLQGETTRAVLITLASGKVVLVGSQGEKLAMMSLDLPAACAAIVGDLDGKGTPFIAAADVYGSVYGFDRQGHRLWKFRRQSKARDFRLLVCADLDGDGKQEVLFSDDRGTLICLDGRGRLRLEVKACIYRTSAPAIGDIYGDGRPEIILGTEAKDVFCLRADGELLWAAKLDGPVGRALPVIGNVSPHGRPDIYIPSAFVSAAPGLSALNGATGAKRWKAPSTLQSYMSTAIADLNGDGKSKILFGDKNTQLYCLDRDGKRRWATQLDGRGIFFAPAIIRLKTSGKSLVFQIVRGAGSNGKSLYVLDAAGKVLEALALPGGGADAPILCRFQGQQDAHLLVATSSGKLICYRLSPELGATRILWSGPGNSLRRFGAALAARTISSRKSAPSRLRLHTPHDMTAERLMARLGTNPLPITGGTQNAVVSVRVQEPGGVVRMTLTRIGPGERPPDFVFVAARSGEYDITARWLAAETNRVLKTQRFLYTLPPSLARDTAEESQFEQEWKTLRSQIPKQVDLLDCLGAQAQADYVHARTKRSPALFDALRQEREYILSLAGCCRRVHPTVAVLVHQIHDPWPEFTPSLSFAQTTAPTDTVQVRMLGNAAESAALAVTNLRPCAVTVRFVCSPFRSTTGVAAAARQVVQLREVLQVIPSTTGRPTEDPLPLLGQGQTFRLDPGETRKIWLTFRSRDLAPGEYRASLRIGDLTSLDPPVEIPVALTVYALRLPERFTYHHCNWLYLSGIQDAALREAVLQDALDHHTNVFIIPAITVHVDVDGHPIGADTEPHDQLANRLKGQAFLLISGSVSVAWPTGFQPDGARQQRAYAEALRWYAAHMQALGWSYEDYALYLADEPGLLGQDASFAAYVQAVERVKAADPRLQVYANPAGGARAEILRPLQGLIDVWSPDLHLVREQPAELGALFQRARQYWHYEAVAEQRNLDPLGYYRMKPWVAFQLGMNGGGYWVYSGEDWWFADPLRSEYGSVYLTDRGVVTTKRWEASREGIEDFELLRMVREAAQHSPSPQAQSTLHLLDEAVRFVTQGQENVTDISRQVRPYTPDFDRWMTYRDRLIQAYLALSR
jgi:outer membrane protein assembly factor BamB